MLALLCLVSSCLLSTLRAAPLIILILREIMLEENACFSDFSLPISIFQYMHGFTTMLKKVSALPASFSLSFNAFLVLGSVSSKNSTVHFSFFCQSRTFAVLTWPLAQLFLPSVFCEYSTYTQSQAGERGGTAETLGDSCTGTLKNLVIPSLIQPCSSLTENRLSCGPSCFHL